MNKKTKTIIITIFSLSLLAAGCKQTNQSTTVSTEIEKQIGGSCNRIESEGEGYCSDYVGEKSTYVSPCSSKYYSPESCPPSSIGGCKFNSGTEKEKIVWSYSYGGYSVDKNQVESELKPSCSNRGGQWVGATK